MTEEEAYLRFHLYGLPEHMRGGMYRWIEYGILPGSFGLAILRNNLVDSYGKADEINLDYMKQWAFWLYNYAPADCWGSRAKIDAWMEHKGLNGLEEKKE